MLQHFLASVALSIAPSDHAALHPANIDLYIEAPDVQSVIQAYSKAPLVQTLNDESVAKLAEFTKQLGWDLKNVASGLMPLASPDHPSEPFWPWSSMTRMSISMSGVDAAPKTGEDATQNMSGWLAMDFKDAASAAQALAAIGATGGVTKVAIKDDVALDLAGTKHALSRFELTLAELHVPTWFVQLDERLVAGIGHAQPADLAQRLSKPETSFLEKSKQLADESKFPKGSGTTLVRAWSDLERIPLPAADGEDAWMAEAVGNLLLPEVLPFVGAKGRWRLQLRGDRFVSESLYEHIGPAKELDSLYGSAPLSATTARMVSTEAIGAWVLKLNPQRIEALLERFLLRSQNAGAPANAASAPADGAPKLADAVGDGAALYMLPYTTAIMQSMQGGEPPLPRIIGALELKDGAAFQKALDAWIERVKKTEPTLSVETKPYRKLPIYSFADSAAAESGTGDAEAASKGGLRPTLAILPDRVLIAPSRAIALAEIRRIEGKPTDVHPIAAEGLVPREAFEASTMDWGGLVGRLYDLARGFVPMLAQGGDKSVDVNLLPTSAELFRFFKPSFSYSKRIEGAIYTYSESSFGPETPLGIVALAGVASSSTAMSAATPPPQKVGEPVSAPVTEKKPAPIDVDASKKATLDALRTVKTGLAVYRSQSGRYPDKLEDLLKGTDNFPKGFLDGAVVPKDGWSRALVYAAQENGVRYALRSTGSDGIDQNGAGDDVNVP